MTIINADCIEAMNNMEPESIDAIVTDPPYGLGFMGKAWDDLPPGEEWARACLRVLKPGGHLLAFGGTRTWHRLAVAVEDAGFEIRDSIAWMYGSGFPKSLDVSKAIDKAAGAERTVSAGRYQPPSGQAWNLENDSARTEIGTTGHSSRSASLDRFAPATPAAQKWEGWGTALKPAFEPVVMARKPLIGTVAANVLAHGTGALNIDGCRIGSEQRKYSTDSGMNARRYAHGARPSDYGRGRGETVTVSGRWPANVMLDEHAAEVLDGQSGRQVSRTGRVGLGKGRADNSSSYDGSALVKSRFEDSGGASRFFYVAKAPKSERPNVDGIAHPTVKPLALMRHLVRLVTPEGGTVLDPFAGSGTTVEAAILEGFDVIGIEREAEYLPLIELRLSRALGVPA